MIKGQRCLVTGGAGTIGSAIVDQLVAAEAGEVVVLDNFVRGRGRTSQAFSVWAWCGSWREISATAAWSLISWPEST